MLGDIHRCSFQRAKDTLDLHHSSEGLACKIADGTLELVLERCVGFGAEHCLGFDAQALEAAVQG